MKRIMWILRSDIQRLILALGVAISIAGCSGPPQVVDDEECFSAVDALWTAVTSKRTDLLEQTATEFEKLQDAGRLSAAGLDALRTIIETARKEEWTKAAKSLKVFMQGQKKSSRASG